MIIKQPVTTEKAMRLMEAENTLVFVVDAKAVKADVRREVEDVFGVKVVRVNTVNGHDGKKRAFVKFGPESPAIDVATKLGMM
ncbi:MAG: 50S ribosomal protein L23 [Nitrosarchaeum sp.]|nr:50S ribosomal protein L23 [Nitrosarchaeum sp.]